jgi:hypothetical protein
MKSLYECKEIKDRAALNRNKESSKGKLTTRYLVLYDLLVPLNKRHKGNGSFALHKVEKLSLNLGLKKILLNPEPFEGNYPKEQLIDWYISEGYETGKNGTGEMENILRTNAANLPLSLKMEH